MRTNRPVAPPMARRSNRAVRRCLVAALAWTAALAVAAVGFGQVMTTQLRTQPAHASTHVGPIDTADPAVRKNPREQRGDRTHQHDERPDVGPIPVRAMIAPTGAHGGTARSGDGPEGPGLPPTRAVLPAVAAASSAGPTAQQVPRPLPAEAITQRGPPPAPVS